MPMLTCRSCRSKGDVRDEEAFEVRGQWPAGHWPVRKCRACGAGLIVKPRLFPPGVKGKVIPGTMWTQMEEMWDSEFGGPSSLPYQIGDRVELVRADDVTDVPIGARGVVEEIEALELLGIWIGVRWDDQPFSNVFPDAGAVLRRVD